MLTLKKSAIMLTVAIITICTTATAQQPYTDNELSNSILEDAADIGDDDYINTAQASNEYLQYISEQKININTASYDDLRDIPLLSDLNIHEILEYRFRYGSLCSLGELKAIKSISTNTLRQLPLYIYAGNSTPSVHTPNSLPLQCKQSFSSTIKNILEQQSGYRHDSTGKASYLGNSIYLALKYRCSIGNNIALGITCEKDAGENINFGNRKYGFDSYSVFLKLQNIGKFSRIIVGDYTFKFANGLILGGGFSPGKTIIGSNTSNIETMIHEHTSTGESMFYRGIAASALIGTIKISAFVSADLYDASCNSDSTFQSINNTGYHRTERELDFKDNLRETSCGLTAWTGFGNFKIGAAMQYYCYDKTFVPRLDISTLNMRSEKYGTAFSLAYRYANSAIHFDGETALDAANNIATINILEISAWQPITLCAMYRNYSAKYLAPKSSAYSQASSVRAEEGIYAGLKWDAASWCQLQIWTDVYSLKWPTYTCNMPADGTENMAQASLSVGSRHTVLIRYKYKNTQQIGGYDSTLTSGYLKISNEYSPMSYLKLTATAQWSRYKEGSSLWHGYLVYQNIQWNPKQLPFAISARYALFSSPYNARIYANESDVIGSMSIPGYYYDGARYYIMASCKLFNKLTLQLKLSQWKYFDRTTISSGATQIDGSHKSEINFYIKYNL